jgi:hypothetical protein
MTAERGYKRLSCHLTLAEYSLTVGMAFKMGCHRGHIFSANVCRQQSLAGGNGESEKMEVKALGMLFYQHPLCLNAEPR